jgi:hypothetical protein
VSLPPLLPWRAVPREALAARRLLDELFGAFGIDEARRRGTRDEATLDRLRKRVREGLPTDPAEAIARGHEELILALPLLTELVSETRSLNASAPKLLQPRVYERRWQEIVDRWNAAIIERGWLTLPPLCSVCGTPVLLKAAARGSRKLGTECSAECVATAKSRRSRLRQKFL